MVFKHKYMNIRPSNYRRWLRHCFLTSFFNWIADDETGDGHGVIYSPTKVKLERVRKPKTSQNWCKLCILPALCKFVKLLDKKSWQSTSINRLVIINLEQAMQTHPDMDLITASLQQTCCNLRVPEWINFGFWGITARNTIIVNILQKAFFNIVFQHSDTNSVKAFSSWHAKFIANTCIAVLSLWVPFTLIL